MTRLACNTDSGIDVDIVQSWSGLSSMDACWRQLLTRHGVLSPNVIPERYVATASSFGGDVQPFLAVFSQRGKAKAMLLGRQQTRRVRRRFGYAATTVSRVKCLDLMHGGVLVDDEPRVVDAVSRTLAALTSESGCDLVTCHRLPMTHVLRDHLVGEHVSSHMRIDDGSPHLEVPLIPHDFDASIRGVLSKKRRHEVRREHRRLSEHFGGSLRLVTRNAPADIEEVLSWSCSIARETYKAALRIGIEDTPQWRAILTSSADLGLLRTWFLMDDDRPIAFAIGTVVGTRYFLEDFGYAPAFAKWSPGKNMLYRVLEQLCEQGVERLDFGFGDAQYKRVFGQVVREEGSISMYGRSLRARTLRLVDQTASGAQEVAQLLLPAGRGVTWLKRVWKRRLAS